MPSYGILIDSIRYIEAAIWFTLIGFLIYLIINTKLTHVKDFRNRFVSGIVILLIATSIFSIVQRVAIFTPVAEALFYMTLYIFQTISDLVILSGLFKLDEYIDSLIGLQERRKKRKLLFVALAVPIALFALTIIVDFNSTRLDFWTLIRTSTGLPTYIVVCFVSLYCFVLHQDMKMLKINMMNFFGIGFMNVIFVQALSAFFALMNEGIFWVMLTSLYLCMMVFLVYGYLNFKSRLNNIKKSLNS